MELNLRNPLVFVDLETTGIDIVKDRIVEIAAIKVTPNQKIEKFHKRVNPTIPIPPEVTKIHGISDEDIKDAPTFKELAKTFANFIEGCDLCGYNSTKFDFPLLAEEFLRADVDYDFKKRKFVDVQVIFHKMEQRTLSAAYKFYCDKTLDGAHSADADTFATFEVLKAQLDRYENVKNDVDFLADFTSHNNHADFAGRIIYNKQGVEVFNFGKFKGKPVAEVLKESPGYYAWMMNGDFPQYTKKVLTQIKLRELTS